MLLKDENIELSYERTQSFYEENDLVVYNLGCLVADADAMKLFYMLKDIIKKPTLIVFCCNVTKSYATAAKLRILKLKEEYANHKLFITGCINEESEKTFKNLGTLVYKKDMWDIKNYD
jgi:tRNA A37 methylthiotransferase MiaB